jgi:hypothetical protein
LRYVWSTVSDVMYQVQFNTNLVQTNWSDLGAPVTATNTTMSGSDAVGPEPQRSYRVITLP